MRTRSICLAIMFVLISASAPAQRVQTNGLRDRQFTHLSTSGTNAPTGRYWDSLSAHFQEREVSHFVRQFDAAGVKGVPSGFPGEYLMRDQAHSSSSPSRGATFHLGQICVIDTAIVRAVHGGRDDVADTTRHLYSFNAKGRRTSDLTQKLTGDLWVDIQRGSNIYDANGNQTSYVNEYWSNGQWRTSDLWIATFETHKNLLLMLVNTTYSPDGYTWSMRRSYSYDEKGNRLSGLDEYRSNAQWENAQRYTYTYDASGNRLTEVDESWSNGEWMDSQRSAYTYDANRNMLSEVVEYWSNGEWVDSQRYTYTFDANGNMLSELDESWSAGQLMNIYRRTSSYDANRNMLSLLNQYWSNGEWVNSQRSTYTYDANGKMLSEVDEYWSNGQWLVSNHSWRLYDANGNTLSELFEDWWNGQWDQSSRSMYAYDPQGDLTSFLHHSWFLSDSTWTPTNGDVALTDSVGNSYDFVGYDLTLIRKTLVAEVTSGSGDVPASYSLSQNYPNPFNPSTTIGFQVPGEKNGSRISGQGSGWVTISVYDLLGRAIAVLVDEKKDPGNHTIRFDGSGLSSGVYFYRLEAPDFVSTKKMVIVR